jgi:hypothetical protein
VSKGVTISKLEALLARIRTRAAEPRPTAMAAPAPVAPSPGGFVRSVAAAPPAPPAFVPPAAVAPAFVPPAPVAPAFVPAAPAPLAFVPPAAVAPPAFIPPAVTPFSPPAAPPVSRETSSEPPEAFAVDEPTLPPPPLAAATDADFAVDVDVPSGTPEPAAVAPPEGGDATDSRERLSAAPPVPLDSAADSVDAGPSVEQVDELLKESNEETSEGGIAGDAIAASEIAGDEDDEIEETPASSRRPVTSPPEERLAELAFGADEQQPARHTPPPKSGRLPAPPAVEFDADVTGVRATPGVAQDDEVPSAPRPAPSVLAAQVVRPSFESGPSVVVPDVIGEAQRFAPATFLALLDASLSL